MCSNTVWKNGSSGYRVMKLVFRYIIFSSRDVWTFPGLFEPGDICNFIQGCSVFHSVVCHLNLRGNTGWHVREWGKMWANETKRNTNQALLLNQTLNTTSQTHTQHSRDPTLLLSFWLKPEAAEMTHCSFNLLRDQFQIYWLYCRSLNCLTVCVCWIV